tara:strand:+ start:8278 stop:8487 length:210 start_codon:yes stop_codon:yes gene_type:complete
MNQETYQIGDAGHPATIENQSNMNQDLTYKLRLKVLQGRFDPDPKDTTMIKKFKESGLTPEQFLETWNG